MSYSLGIEHVCNIYIVKHLLRSIVASSLVQLGLCITELFKSKNKIR